MPLDVLVDSDVILKLCLYSITPWEAGGLLAGRELATLEASRYILPKRLQKMRIAGERKTAAKALDSFDRHVSYVEPEQDELALAAALELSAQRNGVAFDSGESQLLALLFHRNASVMITGDKRAITALVVLGPLHDQAAAVAGKIACLEQLFIELLKVHGAGASLRAGVCSEPAVDVALSICFRCASDPADDQTYLEGLTSYLDDVRRNSGPILCGEGLGLSSALEKNGIGGDQPGYEIDR